MPVTCISFVPHTDVVSTETNWFVWFYFRWYGLTLNEESSIWLIQQINEISYIDISTEPAQYSDMLQLNKFIFDDINWMHTLSMSIESRIKQITLKDCKELHTCYLQWLDDEKMVKKKLAIGIYCHRRWNDIESRSSIHMYWY